MGYNGWIIYTKKDAAENKAYIDWFIKEAALQNVSLTLIVREYLNLGIINNQRIVQYRNTSVQLPDFAVIRTIEPVIQMNLIGLGVKVFNKLNVAMLTNHKAWTYQEVSSLNIPMVDTIFCTKNIEQCYPPFPFPFVVKEATGRSGKQVFYISNEQEWENCRNSLQSTDYIVQTCNVKLGCDVRVFVIGKEIIGAVLRKNEHDFRANYKLGGTATWYPLNYKERILIQKIIDHFDFDLVGIDFLIGNNGQLLFNEIEDVVGSRILSAVSDINLLKTYVTHIKNQLA
ncbi:ATP-grasp domain-containing protein [Virgibacillus sp. W0430]|uniref:ATP-grasp domain-containing protein n=1 Tax=Virgibacillus sp. W0430 TaxID=3391580 RepID=UPI003F48BCCA